MKVQTSIWSTQRHWKEFQSGGTPVVMTQSSNSTREARSKGCLWFAEHNILILIIYIKTGRPVFPHSSFKANKTHSVPTSENNFKVIQTSVSEEANVNRKAGFGVNEA